MLPSYFVRFPLSHNNEANRRNYCRQEFSSILFWATNPQFLLLCCWACKYLLAISVVHHRGKILKQMNIKEVVRGEGLAVSTLDYPVKEKEVVLSLNGWDLLISAQLPALYSRPACLSMHVFWVGNALSCYVSSFSPEKEELTAMFFSCRAMIFWVMIFYV